MKLRYTLQSAGQPVLTDQARRRLLELWQSALLLAMEEAGSREAETLREVCARREKGVE